MKVRSVTVLLLASVFIWPAALRAQQDVNSLQLIDVIPVPGNPVLSADIGWVDPATQRYYIANRSNLGVDIFDAVNHVWVGRVGGMAGPLASGGGTIATNGPGPNGVLVTPDKILWAGDGNSTVQVANVDPNAPDYLDILASISTNIPDCDDGSAHYCGRADELGYDPRDRIILIANNAPLSVMAPHGPIAPYATFISADAPYHILGRLSFPGAGGLEQPLWDRGTQRFYLTVPGSSSSGVPPFVAVINAITMSVENTYAFDCPTLAGNNSTSVTGIALGQNETVLVSACGYPILINAATGNILNVVGQVGGGDEVWYNPGDDRFYVTAGDSQDGVQSLGLIDGTGTNWIVNAEDIRGRNPAAFPGNNHVFTVVSVTNGIVADPSTDDSVCTLFGLRGRGCIAVFGHPDLQP
jgi:hypothetical protein